MEKLLEEDEASKKLFLCFCLYITKTLWFKKIWYPSLCSPTEVQLWLAEGTAAEITVKTFKSYCT